MDPKLIGSLVKPPPQSRGKEDYSGWANSICTDMTFIDGLDLLEGREEASTAPTPLHHRGRGRERGNSQEAQNHAQEQRTYEEEAIRYRKKKAKLFAYLYKALHPSIQYQGVRFKKEKDVAGLWQALKKQYSARTVADIVSLYRGLATMRFRDAEYPAETVVKFNSCLRKADERLTASMGAIDTKVLCPVMYLEGMEPHFPHKVAMLLRDNQHAVPDPQGLESLDFQNVSKPQGQSTDSGLYCEYHKKHRHSSVKCKALKQSREVLAKFQSSNTQDILYGSGQMGKHKSWLTHVRSAKAKAAESNKHALLKLAKWIVNSGNKRVMTYTKPVFLPGFYRQLAKPEAIELADRGIIMVFGTDTVMFNSNFMVHNALYARDLTENLIPTRIPGRKGLTFTFDWDLCDIT
ncbi:hypothetical protein BJ508DRAFT_335737 [Ascobolus immersus RN42]|uniref:Uncharacterized protein n=1 Tax=Ascobolus immersus RN42 TaxID=1160509 RepID=A0A3N4HQ17_ASCIM|nr:hypothetical protein BJ508DRAFT_335737 [Ascobolus immersus RN42]